MSQSIVTTIAFLVALAAYTAISFATAPDRPGDECFKLWEQPWMASAMVDGKINGQCVKTMP